ncbi:MAG TPA: DinB family protein [Planctomycetaceae bacterium]|jgi:uncharacterized damage-inducible protein DinB|nr:DinB family protein [Planctomycetaceae bacterium]
MTTSEISRIVKLSRHTFDGTPWYGTALCKLLTDVSAEAAAAHPIPGTHSIWQEVLHAITWRQVAIRLLNGEQVADVSEEQNWPQGPAPSAAAWRQTLDELAQTQVSLEAAAGNLTDERLSEKAPGKPFSFYVLLHGIIQHDAYHAGQIALLKKAAA